jgi:hypothetical protein
MLAARNRTPVRRRDFAWLAIFTNPFSGRQPFGDIKAAARAFGDIKSAARIIYLDDKLGVSRCGLNRVAHGNTRLLVRQKKFLFMLEFQARLNKTTVHDSIECSAAPIIKSAVPKYKGDPFVICVTKKG